MSLETNFYLMVRGVWIPIPDVEADIKKALNRARSSFESIGGVRYEQQAAKANSVWDVEYSDETSESHRLLTYAASGKAGPMWLYDVQAAQANMFSENKTQGTSTVLIDVDGIPMPAFAGAISGLSFIPVRAGIAYHLSYTTIADAGATIGQLTVGDDMPIKAPDGMGPRRGSLSFVGPDSQSVTIVWLSGDIVTAARLTEGSVDDLGWMPGENTPCRVVVDDRQQVLRYAYADRLARSDASFQIREVG